MLTLDFYESAKGETIIVTFPDGKIGVVDAHPSASGSRPNISEIVQGKDAHFICLTHPHEDHGADLPNVFKNINSVSEYWHSVTDIQSYLYAVTQQPKFPTRLEPEINQLRTSWAKFLIDTYHEVAQRRHKNPDFECVVFLEREPKDISGVRVHFLGPSEREINRFKTEIWARTTNAESPKPNENHLSILLLLEYGDSKVLLGADALVRNWEKAIKKTERLGQSDVGVFKIPHHGASNSLSHRNKSNYRRYFKDGSHTLSILFAGDRLHPNREVFETVKSNSRLMCLSNGLKGSKQKSNNPLNIEISGARALDCSNVCNPKISINLSVDGQITVLEGATCDFCASCQNSSILLGELHWLPSGKHRGTGGSNPSQWLIS